MMTDMQVRLPSRNEAAISCVLCTRPPARVLSFGYKKWRSVMRLCALHYEQLGYRIGNSPLTYQERVAHGVADVEND